MRVVCYTAIATDTEDRQKYREQELKNKAIWRMNPETPNLKWSLKAEKSDNNVVKII